MEILNDTPYAVQPVQFKLNPGETVLTFVVKGLFVLEKDGVCWAAPEEHQVPVEGAAYHEDDIGNSIRVDDESAPHKPRADCLLLANAYAPDNRPIEAINVTFAVGEMVKRLWVFGDRYWVPQADGKARVEGPEPFLSMPLRNEFAFGGLTSRHNPHGTGLFDPTGEEPLGTPLRLPNIQNAYDTEIDPNVDAAPAGFGPLDPDFEPRAKLKGTYDARWQYKRKPLPPVDFDFAYYNAARPDQQVDGYLRGDEPLLFENLHREHKHFHSRLPGLKLRFFLIKKAADGKPAMVEASGHLDTCMVDMEREAVTLIWRSHVHVDPTGMEDYVYAYIGQEELGKPREIADYRNRMRTLLFGPEGVAADMAPPPPPEPEAPDPAAALEEELAEDDRKMMADAIEMLEKGKAPQELVDIVKGQSDPMKAMEELMKYAEHLTKNLPKPPGG